jgi:hypothetical protein
LAAGAVPTNSTRNSIQKKTRIEDIPDDATFKTSINVTASFDLSPLLSGDCNRGEDICNACEIDDIFVSRLREWRVAQISWCYPPPNDCSVILERVIRQADRVGPARRSLGTDSTATSFSDCVAALQSAWEDALGSVTELFLEGSTDMFTVTFLSSSTGAFDGGMRAAFFLNESEVSGSEQPCCLLEGINSHVMKRLSQMGVHFNALVPFGKDRGDQSTAPVLGPAVTVRSISLTGPTAIRGAVDCLAEFALVNPGVYAGSTPGLDLGQLSDSIVLPRIVSSRPFCHASIAEVQCTAAFFPRPQTGSNSSSSSSSSAAAGSILSSVALSGFVSTRALQALCGVLAAIASATASGRHARAPRDVIHQRCSDEEKHVDVSAIERLESRRAARLAAAESLSAELPVSIKDPFQLTATRPAIARAAVELREAATAAAAAAEREDSRVNRVHFSVSVAGTEGVSFVQERVVNAAASSEAPARVGSAVTLREVSWSRDRRMLSRTSADCSGLTDDGDSGYQVDLARLPEVQLLSDDELGRLRRAAEEYEATSVQLEPLRVYSKYA